MHDHEKWMRIALEEAICAASVGEIPIGAVIVDREGNLLARTHNLCEMDQLPTHHAEILAIEAACQKKGSWRLSDCTLYVTLEPCPMCMGALIHARIERIVFGAPDPRAGACGSLIDFSDYPMESSPEIVGGVLAEDCIAPIRKFFNLNRKK